jgi:nitrate/nitrite transporter NarK
MQQLHHYRIFTARAPKARRFASPRHLMLPICDRARSELSTGALRSAISKLRPTDPWPGLLRLNPLIVPPAVVCSDGKRQESDNPSWGGYPMARTLEPTTMRKVYGRLLPFAILTYFLCYLDRISLWGLAGWQWIYIAEATPTVLLGIVVLLYVTDRPAEARRLRSEESAWLISTIDSERRSIETRCKVSLWQSFWDPKVLLLSLNYLGIITASLGMLLFLPQIVKQLGLTNMQVGWVSMIPYICGAISMLIWGWISDHMGERRWNLFAGCVLATAGLVMAGMFVGTPWAVVGMSIAAMGFYGSKGPFWSMPSMILTGTAAASGIAWINSIGNLGGFFGPTIVGRVRDITGSFAGGLYALAAFALMSAVVSALWLHIPRLVAPREIAGVAAA